MPRRLDTDEIDVRSLLLYGFELGERSPALRRPRWKLGVPLQPNAAGPLVEHGGRADMDRRRQVTGVVEDTGRAGDFILKMVPWPTRFFFFWVPRLRSDRVGALRLLG